MQVLAKLSFGPERHGSRNVFGEVYEYFLGQFALKEGARAGEFYTPKSVVDPLVGIRAPLKAQSTTRLAARAACVRAVGEV